jgi:hypothetical protein
MPCGSGATIRGSVSDIGSAAKLRSPQLDAGHSSSDSGACGGNYAWVEVESEDFADDPGRNDAPNSAHPDNDRHDGEQLLPKFPFHGPEGRPAGAGVLLQISGVFSSRPIAPIEPPGPRNLKRSVASTGGTGACWPTL